MEPALRPCCGAGAGVYARAEKATRTRALSEISNFRIIPSPRQSEAAFLKRLVAASAESKGRDARFGRRLRAKDFLGPIVVHKISRAALTGIKARRRGVACGANRATGERCYIAGEDAGSRRS